MEREEKNYNIFISWS